VFQQLENCDTTLVFQLQYLSDAKKSSAESRAGVVCRGWKAVQFAAMLDTTILFAKEYASIDNEPLLCG
jgi:hypothetical protein